MTLLVGIYCADGIVIAADQQATLGTASRPTVGSPVTKISPIKNNAALYAFSGFTGLGQQIGADLERTIDPTRNYFDQVGQIQTAVCATVTGFVQRGQILAQTGLYPDGRAEALCHSLVGAQFPDGVKLFEITPTVSCDIVNASQWTSIGTGKQNADPIVAFLWDVYWRDRNPRLPEAIVTAYWAVSATIESKAPNVGFDIDVFVLEPTAGGAMLARQIAREELTEDADFIERVKDAMRSFRDAIIPTPQTEAADRADEPPALPGAG
jgi:20S proteasome alpha/beta subunit